LRSCVWSVIFTNDRPLLIRSVKLMVFALASIAVIIPRGCGKFRKLFRPLQIPIRPRFRASRANLIARFDLIQSSGLRVIELHRIRRVAAQHGVFRCMNRDGFRAGSSPREIVIVPVLGSTALTRPPMPRFCQSSRSCAFFASRSVRFHRDDSHRRHCLRVIRHSSAHQHSIAHL